MHLFAGMSPVTVILILAGYFALLLVVARFTKDDSNAAFFSGKKESPWFVVAFGMIGASLSGVTFISVPGWVGDSQFSYFQMVLGYLPGYWVIAGVLLPLYYRLNLTSIYTYLNDRFGVRAYKAGAMYFLVSRIIGASFRLYLVAIVLDYAVFQKLGWNVPFTVIVTLTIALIWLYTFQGGIKTIIWTDTLQTFFMLAAVVLTIIGIADYMNLGFPDLISAVSESQYAQIFFVDDINSSKHFLKNFFAGMFMAIAMTGLDQDMMQKNLSCKSLSDARKNMYWFSSSLVVVNLLFLGLGALLYLFVESQAMAIPEQRDYLFPMIAMDGYLGNTVGVMFILGLVAAAYSSADSALTSLTTGFSIDILNIEKFDQHKRRSIRKWVHVGMSVVLILVISLFNEINNDSVVSELFTAAGFTYGPLLGMYSFGLFTKWKVNDKHLLPVVIGSPILSYVFKLNSAAWLGGYEPGFEILLINGLLTFLGLFLIRSKS